MAEEDRLRHLLRGLQPVLLQKVMIVPPTSCAEFLEKVRQISRTDLMMQTNTLMTMQSQPFLSSGHTFPAVSVPVPLFATPSPAPMYGAPYATPVPTPVMYQEAPKPQFSAGDMQQLWQAIDRIDRQLRQQRNQRYPFPPREGRTTMGDVICFRCNRRGHVQRQCTASPRSQPPRGAYQPPADRYTPPRDDSRFRQRSQDARRPFSPSDRRPATPPAEYNEQYSPDATFPKNEERRA